MVEKFNSNQQYQNEKKKYFKISRTNIVKVIRWGLKIHKLVSLLKDDDLV